MAKPVTLNSPADRRSYRQRRRPRSARDVGRLQLIQRTESECGRIHLPGPARGGCRSPHLVVVHVDDIGPVPSHLTEHLLAEFMLGMISYSTSMSGLASMNSAIAASFCSTIGGSVCVQNLICIFVLGSCGRDTERGDADDQRCGEPLSEATAVKCGSPDLTSALKTGL